MNNNISPRWVFFPFGALGLGLIGTGVGWWLNIPFWFAGYVKGVPPELGIIAVFAGIGMLATGLLTKFDSISQEPDYFSYFRFYGFWSKKSRTLFVVNYLLVWVLFVGGAVVSATTPTSVAAFWGAIASLSGFSVVRYLTYTFLPKRNLPPPDTDWSDTPKAIALLTAVFAAWLWIFQEKRDIAGIGFSIGISSLVFYSFWGILALWKTNALYWDYPMDPKWQKWNLNDKLGIYGFWVGGLSAFLHGIISDNGFEVGSGVILLICGAVGFYPRSQEEAKPAEKAT